MELRHNQPIFNDSKERKQKLNVLINFYHTVKPHKAILGKTPYEFLESHFNRAV
ncbi:hypothetical protein [Gilliamella sp. Choc5-1]|jgi:hypothetical protein|uniref:hypothetical protein n=1 Tax=Gilliamella sp. Choc5-1 TaxID=3120238 RepID=UPI00159ECA43|nr:hypothetical protein [Gilliamella apicola]